MRYLRSRRGLGGLGLLTVVASLTLLVVTTAGADDGRSGSQPGKPVLPASTVGVTPVDVSANDAPNDCKLFYPNGGAPAYSFRIKDGTSKTYTDPASGATFTLTLNPGNPGAGKSWPAYATNTYFSWTSTGAAVVDAGVDGNNERDTTRYSYAGQPGGSITGDGYLHASAKSVDSSGNPRTLDTLDDMSFCYNQLAPISGSAFVDMNGNGANDTGDTAATGLTVTLYSGSGTSLGTTTTDANGTYTFAAEPTKAAYKVCVTAPTTDPNGYLQTLPSSGSNCSGAGQGPNGVTIASLASAGQTGVNFGFEPLGSISGTVYQDNDQNGALGAGDAPQGGWTITLHGAPQTMSMSSQADGTYKFVLPLSTSATYTVCETPPGGVWAESQPLPSSNDVCSATGELLKGNQPQATSISDSLTGNNFGNVVAVSGTSGALGASGTDAKYNVQLGAGKNVPFVVNAGTVSGTGTPFVSLWAGDSTQQVTPLLEQISFTENALNADGTVKNLVYTDTFPFVLPNAKTMMRCKVDPRDPLDLTKLAAHYTDPTTTGEVLPTGETSCVVFLTASGGAAGTGSVNAVVYSAVDGFRGTN